MNIPIYRAKKIDSDEYVIGCYSSAYDVHHYIITHLGVDTKVNVVFKMSSYIHKIDPTTLAIHFPDMLDGQGNKFFASLSKNGIGGDEFITENEDEQYDTWRSTDYGTTTAIFNSNGVGFTCWEIEENENDSVYSREHTKITGIKKEE